MINKSQFIRIKGAREHNLKNISVEIPRDRLTVITGISGSGKSSLAFDTLFAEGYRKYMDSLSTRARQLLEQLPKPEVDSIEGLTPVIAIEQRTGTGANPRSTVATITEIADYGRLLWAMAGEAHCPDDGGRIIKRSLDDNVKFLFDEHGDSRLILVAPYMKARPAVIRGEISYLRQRGYQRLRVNGEIKEIDDEELLPKGREEIEIELVVDRLAIREEQRSRLADSMELAFKEGGNQAKALVQKTKESDWQEVALSQHLSCEVCGKVYDPITTKHFSWDHPNGACEECSGLGETWQFSGQFVVPEGSISIRKGAIKPFRMGSKRMIIEKNALMKQLAEQYPFDATLPWNDLDEKVKADILYGTGERLFEFKLKPGNRKPKQEPYRGVIFELEKTRRETSSDGLKSRLMAYQMRSECSACHGQRLRKLSRSVKLEGLDFATFLSMSLKEASDWINTVNIPGFEETVLGLKNRVHFLNEVGLGYLQLDRPYVTLSGGESQRVRLATQLGMGLVGVTYVLDEPTIGLHPANTIELLHSLERLREKGNTVIVVEHDPDMIAVADHLIEIGPGAGESGGELIFAGTIEDAKLSKQSKTGGYLSGKLKVDSPAPRKAPGSDFIKVLDAYEHNLKNIDAAFPVGLLTVVTGVSGSGKSTVVNDILATAAAFKLNKAKAIPGRHGKITGLERFDRLVRVDQEPIGRSPRSNPATFTKIFDDLRRLFSQTPLAKVRGYGPGRFSFNVRGGRCERCQGDGLIKLDMQFLSDVYVECPSCGGKRYNRETLEVRFKGFNIADVLGMTVEEAFRLFSNQPRLQKKLQTLQAVGLGYLKLGQAAPTLSGGEAQRLKLSLELSKGQMGETLYILDEPTTGLHWDDIQHLVNLLFQLRERGHTLIIIEHNLEIIRLADWVMDLGPGGGDKGGRVVFAGSVSDLKKCESSLTGQALARNP